MKILVDPEIFFYGRCGMVRYYSRLCEELEKKGHTIDLPLIRSNSDFISGNWQGLTAFSGLPLGRKVLNKVDVLSKRWYFRKVREGQYDVVLITSPVFEDEFLKQLPSGKPYVMVVHDTMRCVLGPDGLFDPAGSNADRLAYLVRRAAKAICISVATQQDTLQLTHVPESQTAVIHTGNLLNVSVEAKPSLKLPARYLTFVGDRTGRKNFRFFILSIAEWMRGQKDLFLVCTGKSNVWEADLLQSLGLQDRVLFVDAPDAVLVHLYKNALALVYPSLYEGFGLPALEAMAVGCPVITSTCGALEEVGGEAVQYVNPADKDSILNGVKAVVENEQVRAQMRERGLKQASRFTVDGMVSAFEEVFQEVTRK
ncbi:glycosyltransferase family 4 protein [Sabulibacter ruber]|uniref:glycosyltransferase family 4 protein n=1 Tax=Sabulibacter ruber TaxID=2811901 RepID=UPI001A964BE4|nr:glycosyltransferase family 1 protein [Sabulibacter ruber]